ncbi:hypothetical protein [Moorena sp. SIO2C4]|nr:hypothetical protein [Moorena sp. SIO2C4]NES45614.1 hypothetical protein [Moorena sp. SIO2C4]
MSTILAIGKPKLSAYALRARYLRCFQLSTNGLWASYTEQLLNKIN